MVKEKIVKARRYIGKKEVNDNHYEWEYYLITTSIYLDKDWIHTHGDTYILRKDEEKGIIILEPAKRK